MLTIIIGIAVVFGLFFLADEVVQNINLGSFLILLGGVTAIASILIALFEPVAGFNEPELKEEIELVSLNNSVVSEGIGGLFYVSVTAENVYSYRIEVPNTSEKEGKMYELKTVKGNVKELETDTTKAVLRVYKAKPKRWLWTFAIGASETSYVFEVPYGSITHEIALS